MLGVIHFIIFGWPRRTKEYGVCIPAYCPHCNNSSNFILVKLRRWLSLFFIPILPISPAEYYLVCEICTLSAELESDEVDEAKEMVRATRKLLDGDLDDPEYNSIVIAFQNKLQDGDNEFNNIDTTYCVECGAELSDTGRYCDEHKIDATTET
jgi:hypothetical protein